MGVRDTIAKALMGAVGGANKLARGGIDVYHSSPHDFERFDLSKMGTGEGAQAYGHGLYFAENPAISGQGGQYWQQFVKRFPESEQHAASRLRNADFNRDAAIENVTKDINDWQSQIASMADKKDSGYYRDRTWAWQDDLKHAQDRLAFRTAERDALLRGGPVGPRTYEVNINADPAQMLDWDKPLAQQKAGALLSPEMIDQAKREAYNRALASTSKQRADELWGMVKDPMQAPGGFMIEAGKYMRSPEISAQLNERGIPGIKYLDAGSRVDNPYRVFTDIRPGANRYDVHGPGNVVHGTFDTPEAARTFAEQKHAAEQTSNYVVFDPSIIDITRKYGIAGAAAAPAVGAAMGSTYDQNQYEAPP